MENYQLLLKDILLNGKFSKNRTGVKAKRVFGRQLRFDLSKGFPAVTLKKLAWKSVVGELLWFLEGSTDERRLAELTYSDTRENLINKRTIWTDNADNQGVAKGFNNTALNKELGNIYGSNWRNFGKECCNTQVDQISEVIKLIKDDPESRRMIVTAWNPIEIDDVTLPACHSFFQFNVMDGKLNCMMTQRSCDAALGLPFNIASYALLTHIIARDVGLNHGELIISIGDLHIYETHFTGVKTMLDRQFYNLPTLDIDVKFDLQSRLKDGFMLNDAKMFRLSNYKYYDKINLPMAV